MHWTLRTLYVIALTSLVSGDTFCRYPDLAALQEPKHHYHVNTNEFNANCLVFPNFNATIQSSELIVQDCASAQYRINNYADSVWKPYTAPVHVNNGQTVFVKCADSPPVLLVNPPTFHDEYRKGVASSKPSVFVVMVDAVAVEALRRLMPSTLKMLQTEKDVDVFDFTKFATVGLNSNPNKFALFGRHLYDRDSYANNPPKLSWIWEHAKKLGYTTMIAEDECPRSDSVWNLMNVPTRANKLNPEDGPDFVMLSQMCVDEPHPNKYCVKGRWGFEYVVDYVSGMIKEFERNKSEKPVFMWSNFIDAHEPDQWAATLMDDLVVNYLRNIIESSFMNNGVIVFLSDHGIHFGDFAYSSTLGAAENRHPFMYVLSTKGLLNNDILSKNQDKLVTMNDLYRSMSVMIGHDENFDPRDVDIFNQYVPADRTCEMADVPPTYCLCSHTPAQCAPAFPAPLWEICVSRYAHPKFFDYKYYNDVHLKPTFGRAFTECEAVTHWCSYGLAGGWNATSTDSLRAYVARTPDMQAHSFCWLWPYDCNWGHVAEYYFTIGYAYDTNQ